MTSHIVCVCTPRSCRWPPNTKSVPWLHVVTFWLVTIVALSGVDALPDMTPAQSMVWNVSYITISPLGTPQQVIGINDEFPGPLIDVSTNDVVEVNVFNHLDEPLLFTWNGIQQRHNSWQDGVLGTTCEIPSRWNWTYKFQVKDQVGSFFYYPSTRLQRTAGGYGGIRVKNVPKVPPPFAPPAADHFVLIGDWYTRSHKELRKILNAGELLGHPDGVLVNGYGPYNGVDPECWVLPVDHGSTYRLRISNVGTKTSLNFRVQGHKMVLVETEGSYTQQESLDSLDVHVGQSYSVLVTADQTSGDYFIMASPRFENATTVRDSSGVALMHYSDSTGPATGSHPVGPDPDDIWFSLKQAQSIKWNLTTGAARPNPQGSFHYGRITPTQTFLFKNSAPIISGHRRFAINNVSFVPTTTPFRLADYFNISSGVYTEDAWPFLYSLENPVVDFEPVETTAVVTSQYKGFVEIVFENMETTVQTWHLDGYAFWVVGMDRGQWTLASRSQYNKVDAVARCTTQVFPRSWTAVLVMLDNVGTWNLRSQNLQRQYLGQELYVKVVNSEIVPVDSPFAETIIPDNVLYCGWLSYKQKNQNSRGQTAYAYSTRIILLSMFMAFTSSLRLQDILWKCRGGTII